MNCPKCKTLISVSCKEMCSYIFTDLNGQIVLYEISQEINKDTYLLYADNTFGSGNHATTIFKIIKIPMFEEPLNENQEQRYMKKQIEVFRFSYFYTWKSQEELESIIPRLLNLKAFL